MIILMCFAFVPFANALLDFNISITVIEYQPETGSTSSEMVSKNTQRHQQILADFKNSHSDMIIFPEGSLKTDHSTSAETQVGDNPCDETSYPQYLKTISCGARASKIYVVTNVVEKSKCVADSSSQNCKNFGFYFYNTDLVFDRDGNIVNKYRKFNLFGEKNIDRPAEPQKVIVETDFGGRFGVFTGFDILFKNPAQDLLKEDINGIIYPANWHSELPFLTALQTQQMWAYAHNITLFAAGRNNPTDVRGGSGGSGMYEGAEWTITSYINPVGGTTRLSYQLVTARSSPFDDVDYLGKSMDAFTIIRDNSLANYTSIPLNTSMTKIDFQICSEKQQESQLCCNFTIKLSSNDSVSDTFYTYLLVAYAGNRTYPGVGVGGVEVCGIIACLNSSISSCGQRFPNYEEIEWPVTFEEITITGNFENSENKTQFPNSLLSSISPIDARQTEWSSKELDGNVTERTFSIKKPQNRLLTFAIFGRDFTHDKLENDGTQSGASSVGIAWLLLSLSLLCLITFK